MKRILALDGGGVRGVFSLEILLRIEQLLRDHFKKPDLVLADYFDFFAGTSTGAIIATCLCWGKSVDEIREMYDDQSAKMFQPAVWYRRLTTTFYEAKHLSNYLRNVLFTEDDGKPALLGTSKLKKLLLVGLRNHSTGSAWPLTNNPKAKYNDRKLPDCNLNIPLWQVVRASTAAPSYFEPEVITLGETTFVFVDGGLTPFNNPSVIAVLTAILPPYNLNWEPGPDNIRLISIGTLRFLMPLPKKTWQMWHGYNVTKTAAALIETIAWEQDFLSRTMGECTYGEPLDGEVGDLIGAGLPRHSWTSYVRYNKTFKGKELQSLLLENPHLPELDSVASMGKLKEIGQKYAAENVKIAHLI